jgi:hypothetical protein
MQDRDQTPTCWHDSARPRLETTPSEAHALQRSSLSFCSGSLLAAIAAVVAADAAVRVPRWPAPSAPRKPSGHKTLDRLGSACLSAAPWSPNSMDPSAGCPPNSLVQGHAKPDLRAQLIGALELQSFFAVLVMRELPSRATTPSRPRRPAPPSFVKAVAANS